MTVLDSLVLRSPWQTLVVTRSVMPMRAAHMRPTGGADLRAALDAIIAANAASALEISAFWLSLGGQAISVLRTTELVAAIAGAVEAGRLRAFVFREPAYVCQSDFQSLRAKAELAVRQTGTGGLRAPAPARTVEDMEVAERFVEVFRRAIPRVGPELGRRLRELVENPAQLALMVGTIVILAQLHAVAAGEVIDGIVLAAIIACAALEGMSALEALAAALETVGHLVNFIVMTLRARDEPDLDRAAEMLAAGLSLVGVTLITATFERIAGRFTDSLKRIGRQRKIEDVAKGEMKGKGRNAESASPPRSSPNATRGKDPQPSRTVTSGGENALSAASSLSSELGDLKSSHSGIVNIGKPGPLPNNLASTFTGGRYDVVRLKKDTIVYRAGTVDEPLGQFFSPTTPRGILQTRIDQAVKPIWDDGAKSPLNSGFAVKIPAGTEVYVGKIGTQGGPFSGGNDQIVVVKPWMIEGTEVTAEWPLK